MQVATMTALYSSENLAKTWQIWEKFDFRYLYYAPNIAQTNTELI